MKRLIDISGTVPYIKPEFIAEALGANMTSEPVTTEPVKVTIPNISFDDFLKVDIRVGKILLAEEVPKSKKLLKLQVYFGDEIETRTIMAGIAADYTAEFVTGKTVLAVVNLEPRSMMGVVSHGMLLATTDEFGRIQLATAGNVLPGSKVG